MIPTPYRELNGVLHRLVSRLQDVLGDNFILSEAKRLRLRYPRIPVAPLLYRVEDNRLYQIQES